jgi:signal transduction histidine kinase
VDAEARPPPQARDSAHAAPPPYLAWLYALLALAVPALICYTVYHELRVSILGVFDDGTVVPPIVTEVYPDGPAGEAGLQVGDALLSVDGVPLEIGWESRPGKTYTLEIERAGRQMTLEIRAVTLLRIGGWQVVSAIVVALAFWGVGTLLLWRRWRAGPPLAARLLFLAFQALALALTLIPARGFPEHWLPPQWMLMVEYGALYLAGPLFFHYHITFPVRLGSRTRRRWVLALLYGLAVLAAVSSLPRRVPWISPAAFYTVLTAVMAMGAVAFVYFRRASPADRRRLRVVVAGSLVGSAPPLFGFVLPMVLGGYPPDMPRWLLILFLAIPLSYLYATARHNLFGIDRLINRTLIYAILSLGLFALFAGPLALLYRYLPDFWLAQAAPVTLVTLVIGLTFDRLRKLVQQGVDTLFYGGWYDYPGVVERVSDALARSLEREELARVLGCQVPELMQLAGAQLLIGERGASPSPASGRVPVEASPAPGLSFPLTFEGRVRGLWTVGPRHDGEDFSPSDRRILHTLARQAEVALNSVLLIERLRRRVDEIRAVQQQLLRSREEERARLARDLHDGPIQVLVGLNLELGLRMATQARPSRPQDLGALRAEVQDLLSELRQVCAALRPPMLDTLGLSAALRALAGEWSADHGVAVDLEVPPDAEMRQLPEDVAVNFYRVVQEALSNVARHAAARRVTVWLVGEEPGLALTIRDDGCGFHVPDDLHDLAAQGHFGLAGMAERAALIGGRWTVESAPGQGTTLRLVRPEA